MLINGIHAKSGGGITYLSNMLPLLAEDEDLELHLFLHKNQFEIFGLVDERVRVHLLDFPDGFFLHLLWEQFILPALAKFMSIDVTFSLANYGPLFAPRRIIMLRNSLAVASSERRPIKRLYWVGLTIMTAISLLTCKRAIAVSEYAKDALTFGMGKLLSTKVLIIHHGVREIFKPRNTRRQHGFLLSVSDIYVQKNLHTLISALSLVREKWPNVKLKLAGKAIDQGYLDEILVAIKNNKLEDSVELLGERTPRELVALYQNCTLFVFPSTVETFGNPLVEAMACAAPIASSNSAAMPEILGTAAKFFDPLDSQDMANAIISLMNDETERNALAFSSVERSTYFSWAETAEKTCNLIKSVAPVRPRPQNSI